MAAAYTGFRVVLLERHQTLLHLQRGCDTRWLHPRFYDWPAPESESQRARLPFLDWAAANAGQVADQIERKVTELQQTDLKGRLDIDLGVRTIHVEKASDALFEVRYESSMGQAIRPCEIVVYGVGFGHDSYHRHNDSYWRNDRYGQSDLDFKGEKKIPYVVSGFGDGALVDIFRLTIRDFRYERIFGEMFPSEQKSFMASLNEARTSSDDMPGSLYDRFSKLEAGSHSALIDNAKRKLSNRLRSDTFVTLNGKAPSFRQGLSTSKVSFSNALLAYLLYRLGAIKYENGEIDTANLDQRRLVGVTGDAVKPDWLKSAKALIVRHGTNLKEALVEAGCEDAIAFLESRRSVDSGEQIYPAGWWGPFLLDPRTAQKGKLPIDLSSIKSPKVEYVPPLLRTHATTFVSTLASALQARIDDRNKGKKGPKQQFRVTLHRLTRFENQDVFQQVTPYKGRIKVIGGVGRFFPVTGGIVGLACRTGSLVVVQRTSVKKFRRIWELTELDRTSAKEIKPYVDSLLCCPFFAPETKGDVRVVMALFVDSADPKFFDEQTTQIISAACSGFVTLLESLHEEHMLHALPTSERGYKVRSQKKLSKLKAELKELGVSFVDANQKGWKQGLTFRKLTSVDLQVT